MTKVKSGKAIKSPSKKSTKTKMKTPKAKLQDHPDLQDLFQKQEDEQERTLLLSEHRSKLRAQKQLHTAKLEALRKQVQIQLYQMWNDSWLQRQKAFDKGFKDWLKMMFG